MRVLVVDDSRVARAVLRKVLGEIGYSVVHEASDGAEALVKLRESEFDLVITDWTMPRMDGIEPVRAIRTPSMPATRPSTNVNGGIAAMSCTDTPAKISSARGPCSAICAQSPDTSVNVQSKDSSADTICSTSASRRPALTHKK